MKKSVLVAGIVFGVICAACMALFALMVQQEADSARAEAMERYGGEQVEVLVATKDIYPGDAVDSSNSTMRTWLSDLLPEGCITNYDSIKGQQVTSLVIAGEAISSKRFSSSKTSLDIPDGCVALSVPAEDVQAVGGAITPGMNVDVYATGSQTSCIGQGLLVLATNADTSGETRTNVSWVTLAVPLEQSQEFVTASQSMEIYFTLPASQQSDVADSENSESSAAESKSESGSDTNKTDEGASESSTDSAASSENESDLPDEQVRMETDTRNPRVTVSSR